MPKFELTDEQTDLVRSLALIHVNVLDAQRKIIGNGAVLHAIDYAIAQTENLIRLFGNPLPEARGIERQEATNEFPPKYEAPEDKLQTREQMPHGLRTDRMVASIPGEYALGKKNPVPKGNPWKEAEIAVVTKYKDRPGAERWKLMRAELPGRTPSMIKAKFQRLGYDKPKRQDPDLSREGIPLGPEEMFSVPKEAVAAALEPCKPVLASVEVTVEDLAGVKPATDPMEPYYRHPFTPRDPVERERAAQEPWQPPAGHATVEPWEPITRNPEDLTRGR